MKKQNSTWQENFSTYTSYSSEECLTDEEVQALRSFDLVLKELKIHQRQPTENESLAILMLSWEFPPHIVGGLARHVYDLSRHLVHKGLSIHVLTTTLYSAPQYEVIEGVHVHRVCIGDYNSTHFLKWVRELNIKLAVKALEIMDQFPIHLIHAHDWLVGEASLSLKTIRRKPLMVTIHATEWGRYNGLYTQTNHLIHEKEQRLIEEADRVIVCSEYMKNEVESIFLQSHQKIDVVPNGVDPIQFEKIVETTNLTDRIGRQYSQLIFSIGRIVNEKGFFMIIDAAPHIIKRYPSALFLIAGEGPLLKHYQNIINERGLNQYIKFIGFINDHERNALYQKCDIALFPSIYEPFGIVALEGMINGKPTIVSDTGGLSSIIEDHVSGMKIRPGDVNDLTDKILYLLDNEEIAQRLGLTAKEIVKSMFGWHKIADDTSRLYKELLLSSSIK
ncbi:glycosyltransferase family 4 protein [Cytobacillus suaedae]|nr:glycosyltransferase family 4 protein [Cytobacillus suaedae]